MYYAGRAAAVYGVLSAANGNASNPDNNEVASRYIESGMQETGAVNIVTGMILYLPGIRYFWRDKCAFYRYLLCDDYADGGRRGVKEAGGDERSAFLNRKRCYSSGHGYGVGSGYIYFRHLYYSERPFVAGGGFSGELP